MRVVTSRGWIKLKVCLNTLVFRSIFCKKVINIFVIDIYRYYLQPRKKRMTLRAPISTLSSAVMDENCVGTLRLKIHYFVDHILPSLNYAKFKDLILKSPNVEVCYYSYFFSPMFLKKSNLSSLSSGMSTKSSELPNFNFGLSRS